MLKSLTALASLLLLPFFVFAQSNWKPVEGKIMTPFADQVNPENPLPEYPRPQMKREQWKNLNGLWDYAIRGKMEDTEPSAYDGQILVPFAIESALSGVGKTVGKNKKLWYHRSFEIPADWEEKNILLHFGAVDWETTVIINGKKVGEHQGGFDAFTFDITPFLKEHGKQELVIGVWDPTDAGSQPRGKQVAHPEGIWYTSVTGIWQTVWLEPVEATHITYARYYPDIDRNLCDVEVVANKKDPALKVKVSAYMDGKEVATVEAENGKNIRLHFKNPRLWSPEDPFLYTLKLQLYKNGKAIDETESYMGMRKIAVERDAAGVPRIMLNNQFLFQLGFLDQGWWPDGLYTPPTDSALLYDIEMTKKFGYNLLRKHTKVASNRWYYHCDKMGILVWQDMPTGDMDGHPKNSDGEILRKAQSSFQFKKELKAMVDQHFNHPSIIMWVPFNEGWGQFNTLAVSNWIEKYDPTRLVDGPSGWFDFQGAGDVQDMHKYPGPGIPESKNDNRALVLGEYGGLGLPVEGHTWQQKKNWGYVSYSSEEELRQAYIKLIDRLPNLIKKGLSAAVYTQISDVEIEVNGFMTYDRKVPKLMSPETIEKNKSVYQVEIPE